MKKQVHIMYIYKKQNNVILWKCRRCLRMIEITKGKYLQVNVLNEGNTEVIHKPEKTITDDIFPVNNN